MRRRVCAAVPKASGVVHRCAAPTRIAVRPSVGLGGPDAAAQRLRALRPAGLRRIWLPSLDPALDGGLGAAGVDQVSARVGARAMPISQLSAGAALAVRRHAAPARSASGPAPGLTRRADDGGRADAGSRCPTASHRVGWPRPLPSARTCPRGAGRGWPAGRLCALLCRPDAPPVGFAPPAGPVAAAGRRPSRARTRQPGRFWSEVAVKTVSSVPVIRARIRQQASSGSTMPSLASAPRSRCAALLAPLRALLAVVRLHVTVEFPRVIGNLDVDRWQASFVPFRFAAWVHAYLSDRSERLLSVWASGGGHMPAPPDLTSLGCPARRRAAPPLRGPAIWNPANCAIDLHLCR